MAVAPILPSDAAVAAFGLSIDRVRIVVVRPIAPPDTLADTTVDLPPDAQTLDLDLRVPIVSSPETVLVSIVALAGAVPLFEGTAPVEVRSGVVSEPTDIPVATYVGPGAGVDSIAISPRTPFLYFGDSLRFQVQAFQGGTPVSQFYVSWTTSDSTVAPINHLGVLRAPASRTSVHVRARTPSGATAGTVDSTPATFVPRPTQLLPISGSGQTDTIGALLGVPLEAEARAADGLGVGGVPVRFRAAAGGGSVADTLVVSDAAGRARTIARLGPLVGAQRFEAAVAGVTGSPLAFNATALAGPPAQLTIAGGDAQLAIVGNVVAVTPSVLLRDAGGNPVQGVAVQFTVTSGGGSITGGTRTTGTNGIATAGSWTLGTGAGANTLRADAGALTRSFTATGIAGPPARLVVMAGNLQSALVGGVVAIDPALRVEDQFGNPVAGATVTFAVSGGGGSVTGATQLTNAAGVATLGSWALGTAVGPNTLTASLGGITPVSFTATGLAATATAIIKLAGDLQSGIVNSLLGTAPRVKLVDQFGNPVAGASVAFAITEGGGGLVGATQTTDTAGIAQLGSWTLGTAIGPNAVEATSGALSANFAATALAGLPAQIAALLGDGQSGLVNSVLAIAPAVLVRDAFNNPVSGVPVTFTPSSGGSVAAGSTTTDNDGVAQVGSWTLATLAGANTLTATGASLSVGFTATGLAGTVTQLIKTAGDGLTSIVGQSIGIMPVVRALDQFNNPVANLPVTFAITSAGGAITGATAVTNGLGLAPLGGWTLDTLTGLNGVTATAGSLTAAFAATGTPDVPDLLEKVIGDGQTAVVNTALPTTPVVRVVDQYGNVISGATVDFVIQVDGGSLTNPSAITNAAGLASPGAWTLATFVATNLLQATTAGVPPVQFAATGTPDVASQMLAFAGVGQTGLVSQAVSTPPAVRVSDQFGNPIANVPVTFTPILGGGNVAGAAPVTNSSGIATVGSWILGGLPGTNTLEATATSLPNVIFSADGIASLATRLVEGVGNGQADTVVSTLTQYSVLVTDDIGNPIANVPVSWAVTSGGGSITPAQSTTDPAGVATATRTLGTLAGTQTATASVGGLVGSPRTFTATALSGVAVAIVKRSLDPQTGTVGTLVSAAPVVQVNDQFGNAVPGVPVSFAVPGGGILGATLATTDAAGRATAASWTLRTLIGTSTVTASVAGLADAIFTATGFAGATSAVVLFDGDGQTGAVSQALGAPYRVRVTDQFDNPVGGATVRWSLTGRAGGNIAPSALTLGTGLAAATHTLGSTLGVYSAFAFVDGLADTVMFNSSAVAGAAAEIIKIAGDAQTAIVNTALLTQPTVKVVDQAGAPVAGHSVTWAISSGLGTLLGSPTVTTGTDGVATSPVWILGTAIGSNVLTATSPGLTGSPVTFTATGIADAPLRVVLKEGNGQSATVNTAVPVRPSVTVRDQFNNPVTLVQVTFAVTSGGGTVTGATPLTNLQGVATVGSWTLGTVAGTNTLRASALGAQPLVFSATGVAGVPAKLAFLAQPTRVLAGDTIDPAIEVVIQDQYGNRNLTAQGLVQLGFGAMPDPAAKLFGTQAVNAVGGLAIFPELAIDSAGIGYTLRATSGSLVGAESGPFDVAGVIDAVLGDRLDPVTAAFDRGTGLVFVPGQANTLGVLDPSKRQIQQFPILQSPPFGVAVNTQTSRVYVTTQAGPVMIIDARAPGILVGSIDIPRATKGVAVDEATDRVFVVVDGDGGDTPPSLVVIDGSKREILTTIPFRPEASSGVGVAYNPIDDLVYVAIPNLGVGVFDPTKGVDGHVTTIPIVGEKGAAGTFGVAVDIRTRFVYATNRADSSFSIIDPVGQKEEDRLRVGDLPEGLGVDADKGLVYVANSGSGTVSFLSLDQNGRFTVFATLVVGPTPKAAAVDPGSGRVYVPTFEDARVRVVQP